MNNYYIYKYLREDETPYYIGKGKDRRAWKKNKRDIVKVPDDTSRIVIIESDLTNEEAQELERLLIQQYGRKDNGTGILRNLTDGGEGTSGHKKTKEQRDKVSGDNNWARKLNGRQHPLSGKKRPEHSKKMSGDNNPMKRPDVAAEISKLTSGDKNPAFIGYYISPTNEKFDSSRKAAATVGVDKKTLIKWAKNGKNGWSFIPKLKIGELQ
jgi:hypothetical protein